MSVRQRPATKPASPLFSTGPTRKRPGWTPGAIDTASLGRSHRAPHPKSRIVECIARIHAILELPKDYGVAIVPGSDTGAMEMALWSLLGERGVDVLGWEAFGRGWISDVVEELRLDGVNRIEADYGELPDLGRVNFDNDVVFTWNGTASGVRVPDAKWIPADRAGLAICDATSACFAMRIDWDRLDVATFSFQKSLGGEAGHGVIILSPRARARVAGFRPKRAIPKLFRLHGKGGLNSAIFEGATINTPSMMVIEDAIDALVWAESIGGLDGLLARVDASFSHFTSWVAASPHFRFLASDPATVSQTALCLVVADPWFAGLDEAGAKAVIGEMLDLLERENVALDIAAYRDAPVGIRIWGGPTVDPDDIKALLPWIDWAYESVRAQRRDGKTAA